MEFEAGDLVRVRVQLKSGSWTSVVGQICRIDDEAVLVATVAGVRCVQAPDVTAWS